MDFLVLLASGMDATRNWQHYIQAGNAKVERFLGDPTWRERWVTAERGGSTPIRFLAEEYARSVNSPALQSCEPYSRIAERSGCVPLIQ